MRDARPAPSCQDVLLLGEPFGRDEKRDGLADGLRGGVTEHSFGRPIPRGDDTVEILADDGVIRKFDDRARRRIATSSGGCCMPDKHPPTQELGVETGPRSRQSRRLIYGELGPASSNGTTGSPPGSALAVRRSRPLVRSPGIARSYPGTGLHRTFSLGKAPHRLAPRASPGRLLERSPGAV